MYAEMQQEKKWTLSTGNIVENSLYFLDLIVEKVFTKNELQEIRSFQTKQMPLMPSELLKYLNKFSFYRLQEYESNTLSSNHLELWYLVHVWSFIDKVFNDIEELEIVSLSSSRKNRDRAVSAVIDMKRKMIGRRGDMIIQAGRQFEGQNGTKLLLERGLKMPKVMKDMFNQLCNTFDHDERKTHSPAGYVCRISRTKSHFIASNIKEFGQKTLPVIVMAWKAKDSCNTTPPPSQKREMIKLPSCSDTPKSSKEVREIP
ncbi:15273_t:CDS:2, partial [Racocetra fulgida]